MWGPSNVASVPLLSNNTFNAQHWCSQVGRIGPSNTTANKGLWTSDGVPTTTAMKTEQQIIVSVFLFSNKFELLVVKRISEGNCTKMGLNLYYFIHSFIHYYYCHYFNAIVVIAGIADEKHEPAKTRRVGK